MTKQPSSLAFGQLHDFQVDGVAWLRDRWQNDVNCILADEMGQSTVVSMLIFVLIANDRAGQNHSNNCVSVLAGAHDCSACAHCGAIVDHVELVERICALGAASQRRYI